MSDIIWHNTLFKLNIYERSGEAFQDFFNSIATASFGDNFKTVRPWGSTGDHGNDGFLLNEKHYFQLFAPFASSESNPVEATRKAQKDFHRLLKRYPDLRKYTFLMNDRFNGIPEPIHVSMAKISQKFKIQADAQGVHWLRNLFSPLSKDEKAAILNSATPNLSVDIIPALLKDTLDWIVQRLSYFPLPNDLTLPVGFNEKIKFNGIHDFFAQLLKNAFHQTHILDQFFQERPESTVQTAGVLSRSYKKHKERFKNDPDKGNLIFMAILNDIVPEVPTSRPENYAMLKGYQNAGLVIMAKFFEPCAYYENPNKSGH